MQMFSHCGKSSKEIYFVRISPIWCNEWFDNVRKIFIDELKLEYNRIIEEKNGSRFFVKQNII